MLETNDAVKMTGSVTLTLRDEFGNIKKRKKIKNLVVTVGKNLLASRLVGTTSAVMSHMAVGSSSTAPAAGNTTLGTELGRVALTAGTATNNIATYEATFPAGVGTGAVQEAGLFNHATTGTLLCRTVFGVINKAVADSLTVNWNVTIN